ncbi:hypothetical protein ACLESO_46295 [Pyxidicoccus sp. 3LG]
MGNSAQVVVLAEDRQHQTFAYNWLARRGFGPRQIRLLPVVSGRGAGEQDVRKRYPQEVEVHRRRAHHMGCQLVVVVDADTRSVQERVQQLDQALVEVHLEKRSEEDAICLLIPKQNVETWILFLLTGSANEEDDFKRPATKPGDECRQAAQRLADTHPLPAPPAEFLPSLQQGWRELKRVFP